MRKASLLFVLAIIALSGCTQAEKKGSFIIEGEQAGKDAETSSFECDTTPKEREFDVNAYYAGPLIDAHLHMPVLIALPQQFRQMLPYEEVPVLEKDITSDEIVCLLEKAKIKKAIGFYAVIESLAKPAVHVVKRVEANHPGKIAAFLLPSPLFSPIFKPEKLDEILSSNNGVFKGYGELATYFPVFEGRLPNDADFLETYKVAAKHNQIVMLHPTPENLDELEQAIKANPEVKFLLHGGEYRDRKTTQEELKNIVIGAVERNENVFYSIDTQLTEIYGPGKEEFKERFRESFYEKLDETLRVWKPVIEANPDKFVWGTDRLETWHFDEEVGGLVEEIGRAFIGQLDKEVQEKFAYKNAERLLGE